MRPGEFLLGIAMQKNWSEKREPGKKRAGPSLTSGINGYIGTVPNVTA